MHYRVKFNAIVILLSLQKVQHSNTFQSPAKGPAMFLSNLVGIMGRDGLYEAVEYKEHIAAQHAACCNAHNYHGDILQGCHGQWSQACTSWL